MSLTQLKFRRHVRPLQVAIAYPPVAYPFMPYMAPFALKAYVEASSEHRVRTLDWNVEYHRYLWSAEFGAAAARELHRAGKTGSALIAELLAHSGAASWHALRDEVTYGDLPAVRMHAALLKEASRVVDELHSCREVYSLLPDEIGLWQMLVDMLDRSVFANFLAPRIADGELDDCEVIGLSVAYAEQLPPALWLARQIKRRRPQVSIVLGGGAVTHFLDDLLRDASFWSDVDYVVPYEGEYTLVELLDAIATGGALPQNVATWSPDGAVYVKNLEVRPRVEVIPDFSELRHHYPTPAPIYPLLTSKGCYWGKCKFCTHHEGYGEGYFRFDDQRVEQGIDRLIDAGARHFYLVDEALPPRQLTQLATLFERARTRVGSSVLGWMAEARMEKTMVSTPAAELLKRAGCRLLVNGIESGAQPVLDRMEKGIHLPLVERFARDCHDIGIRTGWMLFIGYPDESPEEALETFRLLERNATYVDFASVGTFGLERGSPLWNAPEQAGIAIVRDADKPYPQGFDLTMRDGRELTTEVLRTRLRALHAQFDHLRPLFEAAVDRALVMFFPAKGPGEPRAAGVPQVHRWPSEIAHGHACLDLIQRRIEIVREAEES
jgi:anaerobic magnesium-protoporphyrin IX monomethyl ester cyclase